MFKLLLIVYLFTSGYCFSERDRIVALCNVINKNGILPKEMSVKFQNYKSKLLIGLQNLIILVGLFGSVTTLVSIYLVSDKNTPTVVIFASSIFILVTIFASVLVELVLNHVDEAKITTVGVFLSDTRYIETRVVTDPNNPTSIIKFCNPINNLLL
jgi:hypothetical protein